VPSNKKELFVHYRNVYLFIVPILIQIIISLAKICPFLIVLII